MSSSAQMIAALMIREANQVIGGNEPWLKAPKQTPIETIRLITKDAAIFKNTLS